MYSKAFLWFWLNLSFRVLIDRASSSFDSRLEELGSFLDSSISLRNSFHESDHYKDELKPSWLALFSLIFYELLSRAVSLFSHWCSDFWLCLTWSTRRHYRPLNPRLVAPSLDDTLGMHIPTVDETLREDSVENVATSREEIVQDSQDYKPRAKVRRSFSTQPTSKFTLNSGLSNGVNHNPNFTNPLNPGERDKSEVMTNGPTVNNNNSSQLWNGTTNVSTNRNSFSTAPMKAVYALNFPLPSTNSPSNFSNNLLKGSNKFGTITTTRHALTSRYSSSHRLGQQTPLSRR